MAQENPFARVARLNKARAIVGVIDRLAVERGIDPLLNAGAVVIDIVGRLSEGAWNELARIASVNAPGPDTRAIVRQTYLDRQRLAGKEPKPDTTYSVQQPRAVFP